MEAKKTKKADLENKKGLFIEIGLIAALVLMIVAFNWSSSGEKKSTLVDNTAQAGEEEIIPITEEIQTPPPVAVEVPVVSDQMVIVDNNLDINSANLFSSEDNSKFAVAEVPYVAAKQAVAVEVVEEDIEYAVVQEKPLFMGGDANGFTAWVNKQIVYPQVAQENGISGRVILQFRIAPDGSLTNIKVLRSVDPALDKEAVRVVSMSPKWSPGKQHNKAIGVVYRFPVNFELK